MSRNPYFTFIGTEFSDALGHAINRAASSSPSIADLLTELEGKTIVVKLTDFNYEFALRVVDGSAQVNRAAEQTADLTLQTTSLKLISLIGSKTFDPTQLDGIEIAGDVNLLRRLYAIFGSIQFDWEELLANRIGDIPARQVGNLYRWGERVSATLRTSFIDKVQHTLVEDRYLVPTRTRVEQFFNDVDDLQADVDRLEKRVERLERRG